MTKTAILVLADTENNAGEVDYMYALAEALKEKGDKEVAYLVCTISTRQSPLAMTKKDMLFRNDELPCNSAQYNLIPAFDETTLEAVEGDVEVIGVGRSTLSTVLDIQKKLKEKGVGPKASYLTHLVNGSDKSTIVENDVRVLSTFPDDMPGSFALEDVPHTNTIPQCAVEWSKFAATENGEIVQEWREDGRIYAAVVLNGGIGVDDASGNKQHQPYTAREAYELAYALGRYLPIGAPLLLADGGPRNGKDANAGEPTMEEFVRGYREAQALDGVESEIVLEPFKKGAAYNVTKAILHMSRDPHCNMLAPCEGFGFMAGGLLNSYNHRAIGKEELLAGEEGRLTGFSPSQVAKSVASQSANMKKYHEAGYDIYTVEGDTLICQPSSHPEAMPDPDRNPAVVVAKALQLMP